MGSEMCIRDSANCDRRNRIGFPGQLSLQHFGCGRSGYQTCLKIKTRRHTKIGMGRARKTIDASVFAASIGVYRTVKWQIGRPIVGNHLAWPFKSNLGSQCSGLGFGVPTVIHVDAGVRFEPPNVIGQCSSSFDCDAIECHGENIEQKRNICQGFLQYHRNLKRNHSFLSTKVAPEAGDVAIRTVRMQHYDQMPVKAPDPRG